MKIKDDKAIKILNSVYFLASKFEAFYDRSYKQKNYLDCKDLEDIVNVINGRPELVGEIQNAKEDVKKYISNFIALLINDAKWFDAIKSIARQERSRMIVLNALDKISKLSENE